MFKFFKKKKKKNNDKETFIEFLISRRKKANLRENEFFDQCYEEKRKKQEAVKNTLNNKAIDTTKENINSENNSLRKKVVKISNPDDNNQKGIEKASTPKDENLITEKAKKERVNFDDEDNKYNLKSSKKIDNDLNELIKNNVSDQTKKDVIDPSIKLEKSDKPNTDENKLHPKNKDKSEDINNENINNNNTEFETKTAHKLESFEAELEITNFTLKNEIFLEVAQNKKDNKILELSFIKHLSKVLKDDYDALKDMEKEMDQIRIEIENTKNIQDQEMQKKKLEEIKKHLDKLKDRYLEIEKNRQDNDLEILSLDELKYFKNKINEIEVMNSEDIPKKQETKNLISFIEELESVHSKMISSIQAKKQELEEKKARFEELKEEKDELDNLFKKGTNLLSSQQEILNSLESKVGNIKVSKHKTLQLISRENGVRFLADALLFHQSLNLAKRSKNTIPGLLLGGYFFTRMTNNLLYLFGIKTIYNYDVIFKDYESILNNQENMILQISRSLEQNQYNLKDLRKKILAEYKKEKTKNSEFETLLKRLDSLEEVLYMQRQKLKEQEYQVKMQKAKNKDARSKAYQRKKELEKKQGESN